MSNLQEITTAIESLPKPEYDRLLQWMRERDWSDWDKQLEQDVATGKLDFLADEAIEAKKNGSLRDL